MYSKKKLVVLSALLIVISLVCGSIADAVSIAGAKTDAGDLYTVAEAPEASDSEIIIYPQSDYAYFAQFEGIDGESTDAYHEEWIEINTMEWGAARPISVISSGTRRRGGAEVEDFIITFYYEKAAPKLIEKCLTGAIIPMLEVELTRIIGESRATFLRYELKNVMITDYHVSGDALTGMPPLVTVSVSFEEIKGTYTEYDDEGMSLGNTEFSYNVEKGR